MTFDVYEKFFPFSYVNRDKEDTTLSAEEDFYFVLMPDKQDIDEPKIASEIEFILTPTSSKDYLLIKHYLMANDLMMQKFYTSSSLGRYNAISLLKSKSRSNYWSTSEITLNNINLGNIRRFFYAFCLQISPTFLTGVDEAASSYEIRTSPTSNTFDNEYGIYEMQRFRAVAEIFGLVNISKNNSQHLHIDIELLGETKSEQSVTLESMLRFMFLNKYAWEHWAGRHPDDFTKASMDFLLGNMNNTLSHHDLLWVFKNEKRRLVSYLQEGRNSRRSSSIPVAGEFNHGSSSNYLYSEFNIIVNTNSGRTLEIRHFGYEKDEVIVIGRKQLMLCLINWIKEEYYFDTDWITHDWEDDSRRCLKEFAQYLIKYKVKYPYLHEWFKNDAYMKEYLELSSNVPVKKFTDAEVMADDFYIKLMGEKNAALLMEKQDAVKSNNVEDDDEDDDDYDDNDDNDDIDDDF